MKNDPRAEEPVYPMRINKYLALHNYATRRGGDELVEQKKVFINGRLAVLGDKVHKDDVVEVKLGRGGVKKYEYYLYHKPVGVITHSPQKGEQDVLEASGLKDVFPVGRLDKDSHGLLILTNDGRVTDRLLNPNHVHEKEYVVKTREKLRPNFKEKMEAGVQIEDEKTQPCKIQILGEKLFRVTLTEGKKHQIRRMCVALFNDVVELERVRIGTLTKGTLKPGQYRKLEGEELEKFLKSLGL